MAKLSDEAQLDVANKLTLGIVSTNTDKNYFEEDFAWTPTVLASEIWAEEIPYAATQSEADDVSNGGGTANPTSAVVEKLTMYQMDEVPLSNEQAWAVYETPGSTASTRLVDWLNPQLFGPGYFFELFENDGTPIALTDGRYQVDSKNGVVRFDEGFTPADLGLLTPLRITLYRYIGEKGVLTVPTTPGGASVPHQEVVSFTAIGPTDGNMVVGQTSFPVANVESFRLYLNKLLQVQGQDYELDGLQNNRIIWLVETNGGVSLDPASDQLVALYSEESVSLPFAPRQQEMITENISATDGDTIMTDTLDFPVENPDSVRLFHNKIFQVQGTNRDYSLTGPNYTQIIWNVGTGTAVQMLDTDELVATYMVDADNAIGPTGPAGADGADYSVTVSQASSNVTLSRQLDQYVGLATGGTGGFTVTLPASPVEGDRVWIKDEDANASINNVMINGNGNAIDGDTTNDFVVNIDEQGLTLLYGNGGWRIF